MKTHYEDIERLESELGEAQASYLRERGWEYTSNTPMPCYWLWVKEWKGQRYTLPTDMAISIQRCYDNEEARKD